MNTRTLTVGLLVVACLFATPAIAEEDAGFKPLFDGKTLTGWEGEPGLWRVEDGAIVGQTTADKPLKHNTFLVWRQGELDDFELKLEYRLIGGNSGIQYRSWEDVDKWGKWVLAGDQADIDKANTYTGILYSEKSRGILAERGEKVVIGDDHKKKVVGHVGDAKELATKIRKDDWNAYRIVARGRHLVHEINGQVMVDVLDEDREQGKLSGLLGIQMHVGEPMTIQVRNIQLKRFPLDGRRKIVFVAGHPSHGYGDHEHNAGCLLLARLLNENVPGVFATVYRNGWPADPTAFDNANAVAFYADGGGGNMINKHLDELDSFVKRGAGLAFMHYALEVPKEPAGPHMLDAIGGYFEVDWSVNPFWTARYASFPEHPITRGVKPFEIQDEWYYHMRFREKMEDVTPVLAAIPPDETRGADGPRSGNADVRARRGMPEVTAWAYERPGGGRGFGWTGGHLHWNWANDQNRKLVLNALTWVAGVEVPSDGVKSATPGMEQLLANLDKPRPEKFDMDAVTRKLKLWAATAPAK